MQTVIDDFDFRKLEIERYFEFVEKIESEYIELRHNDISKSPYKIDDQLLKILKANGFLILYNLIESTILNCIVSIFDEIATKTINNRKISYIDVTEKIRKYWIKSKYNHDEKIKKDTVVNHFYNICESVTQKLSLDLLKDGIEFGGNLNAMKIREVAETFGIVLNEPHYKQNLHGQVFLKIKQHRNDLAHGHKSFSAIGKDVTYIGDGSDGTRGLGLVHFKEYTIEHLESFIANIGNFIAAEQYLISTASPQRVITT